MLKIGDKAPEVLGLDQNGKEVKISDFGGKKIILYFILKTVLRAVLPRHVPCATDSMTLKMPVMPWWASAKTRQNHIKTLLLNKILTSR